MLSGMPQRRPAAWYQSDLVLGVLLLVVTVAAYVPALQSARVWDDDRHVTTAMLQGWDGLRRIWFALGAAQQYYPVLHSAFWLEHRLWGESDLGYHLVNVAWHAISACLLVLVGQRLGARGGWVAAFIFALHPVNVESVAWISEQKNTLSLVFYLLAALAWLRFDATRRARDWWPAFALFALALGTKTVTATLPCVLLIAVWWQRGRLNWRRDVVPLLPWIALGVLAGLTTAWVEQHVIGAAGAEFTLSPLQRVLLAGRIVWHYLATFAWPATLVFTYARWTIDLRSAIAWLYSAALLALVVALWVLRARNRAPLAAFLAFVGSLFPVMGFFNVYPFRYAFVADHFQYHASLPLAMLVGAGVAWLSERGTQVSVASAGAEPAAEPTSASVVAPVLGRIIRLVLPVMVLALGTLTWRQSAHYRDDETLYRATLAANPDSWMAHHNLGRIVSRKAGGLNEAIAHFEAAIRLKPDHARAHYSLGVALQRVGRGAEAVPHFEAAIRFEPDNAPLVSNAEYLLGVEAMNRPDGAADAVRHFSEALKRKPGIASTEEALAAAKARAARDSLKR